MRFVRGTALAFRLGFVLALTTSWTSTVYGDGGALRVWKQIGPYDIAVFTDPTPCVNGPIDISILLLDRDTGGEIEDARVTVEISTNEGLPGKATRNPATRQAATNKLLRAAVFELEGADRCEVVIRVDGPGGYAHLQFGLDIEHPWSTRMGICSWILWPVPVIVLFLIHRRLADSGDMRLRAMSVTGASPCRKL